ncbi:hypothetical protein [uncultured Dokdonia sp.]|uniref:hypothetical protein n=1 Tax=uncultured Dokdonia sp. TaxID=575653 RepID=UPI002612A173|nr:hypothetical protein [uncultured Dokdonia sp.]
MKFITKLVVLAIFVTFLSCSSDDDNSSLQEVAITTASLSGTYELTAYNSLDITLLETEDGTYTESIIGEHLTLGNSNITFTESGDYSFNYNYVITEKYALNGFTYITDNVDYSDASAGDYTITGDQKVLFNGREYEATLLNNGELTIYFEQYEETEYYENTYSQELTFTKV